MIELAWGCGPAFQPVNSPRRRGRTHDQMDFTIGLSPLLTWAIQLYLLASFDCRLLKSNIVLYTWRVNQDRFFLLYVTVYPYDIRRVFSIMGNTTPIAMKRRALNVEMWPNTLQCIAGVALLCSSFYQHIVFSFSADHRLSSGCC